MNFFFISEYLPLESNEDAGSGTEPIVTELTTLPTGTEGIITEETTKADTVITETDVTELTTSPNEVTTETDGITETEGITIDSNTNNECCHNINLSHSNDYVPSIYKNLYGTYSVDGTDNHQRQYYLQDDNGYYGIWWCNEDESWIIGLVTYMGTCGSWYASADKSNTCADSFGYDWKWYDYVNGAVLTSAGEGLKLVCANPTTTSTTTAITTTTTETETSTKAPEELDCSVIQLDYVGDDYCDDISNTDKCGWDGGDCCGNNVNYDYCEECDCLDPKNSYFNNGVKDTDFGDKVSNW